VEVPLEFLSGGPKIVSAGQSVVFGSGVQVIIESNSIKSFRSLNALFGNFPISYAIKYCIDSATSSYSSLINDCLLCLFNSASVALY